MSFFILDPVRRVITPLPVEFYRRKITDPEALSSSQATKGILTHHGQPNTTSARPVITHKQQEANAYTESKDEDSEAELVARELMTSPVICTSINTSLSEIWKQFSHHDVHHIGLISESGMLAGVASYETILEYAMTSASDQAGWKTSTTKSLTQRLLITASPEATLTNLALVMLTHQVSAIPVVSGVETESSNSRRLEGIVTSSDILKASLRRKGINFQA